MMEQLAELLRVRGYSPSKQELYEFWSRTGGAWSQIQLQEFCEILQSRKDSAKDFTLFFRVYDPRRTGRITKGQLRILMQAVGEPLTDTEWTRLEVLYRWHQTNQEFVDYAELADGLLKGSL